VASTTSVKFSAKTREKRKANRVDAAIEAAEHEKNQNFFRFSATPLSNERTKLRELTFAVRGCE
jgi:hypothetical protein